MLSAKEAQGILGVSIRQIYILARSGAIAHYRIGKRTIRFEEAQILAYKESCAVAARATKKADVICAKVSLSKGKSALRLYFEEAGLGHKLKSKL